MLRLNQIKNQFKKRKCFLNVVITLSLLFFFNPKTAANLISHLEDLKLIYEKELIELLKKIEEDPSKVSNIQNIQDIKINQTFLNSLTFNSDRRFLNLATKSECHFYSLLYFGQLKSGLTNQNEMIVDLKYADNKIRPLLYSKTEFFNDFFKKNCFNLKKLIEVFNQKKTPEYIKLLKLNAPQNAETCDQEFNSLKKNELTPILCHMIESIHLARGAKEKLSAIENTNSQEYLSWESIYQNALTLRSQFNDFEYSYTSNFCENLEEPKRFCDKYLTKNYWDKILNNEKPIHQLLYRCQALLKKEIINQKDMLECKNKLSQNPNLCSTVDTLIYPSLIPKPNCDQTTMALNLSRLNADYNDCPATINEEGITSIFRLYQHFNPGPLIVNPATCSTNSTSFFAIFNLNKDNEKAWNYKICYPDKILAKEQCHPFILNSHPTSDLAEDKIVKKILERTSGMNKLENCQIIPFAKYKPLLLDYKFGCFLTYNPVLCTSRYCPKQIYYNQKKIDFLRYETTSEYDLFSTNSSEKLFSIDHLFISELKTEFKTLRNLTEISFFLESHKNGIIIGEGCLDYILPGYFSAKSINQCLKSTFLIEGITKVKNRTFMVTRLGVDDAQTPRLIEWSALFDSIRFYQSLHPLKTWTLYGVK
jgi:hypothetical protein